MRRRLDLHVGVVAPSFAVPPDELASGLAALGRIVRQVSVAEQVRAVDGYLAGDDAARAEALTAYWLDPAIDALWFARGGYGCTRLLDALPWRRLRRRSKLLIGYSDATALFVAALADPEMRCLHGPVVTELGRGTGFHRPSLLAGLRGESQRFGFRKRDVLASGRARGRLIGGNLATLASVAGSRHLPRMKGSILLLEEIGEKLYAIDRSLQQLRSTRRLEGIAGVVVGDMQPLARKRFPPERELDAVLCEAFPGVPIVRGLPFGHLARRRTVRLGATARLDTATRELTVGR